MDDKMYHIFSFPNLYKNLKDLFTNQLNFEHTTFLTEEITDLLLSKIGFNIIKKQYCEHSIFYAYTKTQPKRVMFTRDIYKKNKDVFLNYINHYKKEILDLNKQIKKNKGEIFLFGGHIFSQFIIFNGLNTDKIKCILDNSKMKQKKRLYGTSFIVNSPDILKSYNNPAVILKTASYNEEIKKDILNNINKNTIFFEQMGKTKIILTGANGFLGKNLYIYLINQGYNVMTISIRDHNLNEVKSDIIKYQPDIFIHAGWSYGNSFKDINNNNQYDNIKIGVELMKILSNIDNLYFIGLGSFAEYNPKNNTISELDKENPQNNYGLSKNLLKIISEKLCYINNFKWLWIRPCYVFGPNDIQTRLIPKVINSCLSNKTIKLINSIKKLCKSNSKIVFDSNKDRKNDYTKYICGDNNKLKESTKWKQKYNLVDGLKKTIEFYDKK